jgi:hypothetical protein
VPRSAGPDGVEPVEGPGAGVPAESLPVAPGAPTPVPPDTPLPLVDGLPGAVPDDGPLIPGVPPVPDGPLPGVPLPAGSPPGEPLPAPGALEPPAAPLPPDPAPDPPPAWAAATAGASPMTTTKPTRISFLFITGPPPNFRLLRGSVAGGRTVDLFSAIVAPLPLEVLSILVGTWIEAHDDAALVDPTLILASLFLGNA